MKQPNWKEENPSDAKSKVGIQTEREVRQNLDVSLVTYNLDCFVLFDFDNWICKKQRQGVEIKTRAWLFKVGVRTEILT